MNVPIIQPRGPAPAVAPSRFDVPIVRKRQRMPGSLGTRMTLAYQPTSVSKLDRAAFDMTMAEEVGRTLFAHYPGHYWWASCDSKQGVCLITIPVLLGTWKYVIHLDQLNPLAVIRAGGEILERFDIPRSGIDFASFLEARKRRVSRASQRPPGGLHRAAA